MARKPKNDVTTTADKRKLPTTKKEVIEARTEIAPATPKPVVELGDLERVLLQGDLKGLSEPQRIDYYKKICLTVGLNPLTKPFEYLVLDGKHVLYATRNCTDQLCETRQISTMIISALEQNDLFVVRARVTTPTGRQNEAIGAVDIKGMSGKFRANAMMKAETKAKRRAVLSLCGLSFMDEVEVEDVIVPVSKGASAVSALEAKHAPQIEHNPAQTATVFVQQEQSTHPKAGNPPTHSAKTHPPIDANPPTHSTRQISENPETRHDPETGEVEDDGDQPSWGDEGDTPVEGEVLARGPSPELTREMARGAKDPSGSLPAHLPQPTEVIVKMIADGRYVPWMTWIETEGFWKPFQGEDIKAFAIHWNKAIQLAKSYGGAHWKRVKAAFALGGLTLKD